MRRQRSWTVPLAPLREFRPPLNRREEGFCPKLRPFSSWLPTFQNTYPRNPKVDSFKNGGFLGGQGATLGRGEEGARGGRRRLLATDELCLSCAVAGQARDGQSSRWSSPAKRAPVVAIGLLGWISALLSSFGGRCKAQVWVRSSCKSHEQTVQLGGAGLPSEGRLLSRVSGVYAERRDYPPSYDGASSQVLYTPR